MKSLLSIQALSSDEIRRLIDQASTMKSSRGEHAEHPLRHQCWGLIFRKSSTRTRVSFEVAIRELGGDAIFFSGADLQLGRGEPVEDTARVLGRMLHGAVIRTYAQDEIEQFEKYSGLPTINALTDEEHPCQVLTDLFTVREKLGDWKGKTICYLGDGACNMPRSWIWAAAKLQEFELVVGAPSAFQADSSILNQLSSDQKRFIRCETDPEKAVKGADVVYTDVWVSMGKEDESKERIEQLRGYQVNDSLLLKAKSNAIVMHCLPAYRGQEITAEVLEKHSDVIFTQAENRLHVQKAILCELTRG